MKIAVRIGKRVWCHQCSERQSPAFTGGSNFYGSAIAATVTDTGGTGLHFDTTLLNNTTTPAANLNEISLREVAY